MLGRAADAFFARQKSERILAGSPNGDGRSLILPDRGDSGSTAISHVPGNYEMPGPQNTFVQHAQPGGSLPGMGCALPGMGCAMPGMGEEEYIEAGPEADDELDLAPAGMSSQAISMIVLAGIVGYMVMTRKPARRSRRS